MNKQAALITILIPSYQTLKLTKFCLELIHKYTDLTKAEIIVIDNNSQDKSVAYLRTLDWITLIERKPVKNETSIIAHAKALDLALQQVKTPYVLSIHTDTLVKNPNWLDFLLQYIVAKPDVAGVGSWKLELKPWYKRIIKIIGNTTKLSWYRIINSKQHNIQGADENRYYLRSHCALYRMDLIKKYNLTFAAENKQAGRAMHKKLIDAGFKMIFLLPKKLIKYVEHINHATTVLNPELTNRKKSVTHGLKKLAKLGL